MMIQKMSSSSSSGWSKRCHVLLAALVLVGSLGKSGAFLPARPRSVAMAEEATLSSPLARLHVPRTGSARNAKQVLHATNDDNSDGAEATQQSFFNFNPLYGALWVGFLAYGIFFSPGELLDLGDTKMIEGFISDPTNAQGGMNPLFFAVFNALGVMPIVMAQLALPQGSKQGVPAAPFVVGSLGAGFGALGLYLTLRAPPVDTKTKAEASWITANVLDNKLANWLTVVLCGSVLITSGILSSPNDFAGILESYLGLASTSKFVSVSSVDLSVLTIAAAALIPQDLRLRKAGGDNSNATLIAASTLLLPVVGAALYCALRPPLPEE
ncbi:MAG: hypothetical protein SGILL_003720 [Bacillariaceae sp.]